MKKAYYAVKKGRKSNVIVLTWAECEQLVKGFSGAVFKGFPSHQYEQAIKFAQSGAYKNQHKKKSRQAAAQTKSGHSWDNGKYPCIERKSYTDTLTGVFYKNRCVRRQGLNTVGKLYKPHIGTSCPF